MSARERRKGAAFEREVANAFKAAGIGARRGGHRQSQTGDDAGDVVETGRLFIECKRHERLSIPAWIRQVVAACPAGRIPAIVFRRNKEKSWALVPLAYLIELEARILEREAQLGGLR